MKTNRLKNVTIFALVTTAFHYIWEYIINRPDINRAIGRLIWKVYHSPFFATNIYIFFSTIGMIIAMCLGIFVLEKLVMKIKLPLGKKTITVLLVTIINLVLAFYSSRFIRMGYVPVKVARTSSVLLPVLRILVIAFCSLILVPKSSNSSENKSGLVKTKKEELEEGDKWAKIYIYVFIGLFAISYVVTSGMFASLGIAIVGFIVFYIIKMLSQKGNDEEKAKIKAAMQFYDECRKIDLSDFTSEKNIARAEAIVKAHHCGEVSDYAVFYELGAKYSKELNDKVASEEKQERVSKLTEEEKKKSDELNKYANKTGNDKTIAILGEELSSLISQKKALENFGSTSTQLLSKKEKDWAVAGGIASGIAGGAPGVATALDIQAQNAEIRAHNNQVRTDAAKAQMYINSSGAIERLAGQIAEKQEELDKEKIKLVGKIAPEELVKKLTFADTKAEISEAGSVYVDVKISMQDRLMIYEDVVARIDGTVCAVVSKDGREISRVALVLPKYGISTGESCDVQGITLARVPYEENLAVTFTATNLYAIEK